MMPSLDFDSEVREFKSFYADNYWRLKAAEESYRTLVSLLLADHEGFAVPLVTSRVKERDECIAKFGRKYRAKLEDSQTPYSIREHITDLVGIRVVCLYYTDIEPIKAILIENFELLDITDRISLIESSDDSFGYKGLHLDFKLKSPRSDQPEYSRFRDFRFEVQVRTIVQDAWSNLDHKIKYKKSIPHKLKRRINVLAALFELADHEFRSIRDETIELEMQALDSRSQEGLRPVSVPEDDTLDAFKFLRIANAFFEDYQFLAHKVDGFVEEIRESNPRITGSDLERALRDSGKLLNDYAKYQADVMRNRLNPFTMVRHALYLSNRNLYERLLFERSIANFEKWLSGYFERTEAKSPQSISHAQGQGEGEVSQGADQRDETESVPRLRELNAVCPQCGSNKLHLRVDPDEDDIKVRFCLACNTRLHIEPANGDVVRWAQVKPLEAIIVGETDGRSWLECPQCQRRAKAFKRDGEYVFGACYRCEEVSLLRAEIPIPNVPMALIKVSS